MDIESNKWFIYVSFFLLNAIYTFFWWLMKMLREYEEEIVLEPFRSPYHFLRKKK